ncbi:MAG: ASKHA domain-containing protein [Thermodesulfobacteriota bacterium]|nr:ASKHA domain-containing protein [Thermodesulfobacteriota bacterium]
MKHTITFEPDQVSIRVDRGANLLEAALAAGVHINATCGGQGVCGKCQVIIKAGDVESEKTEKIEEDKYAQGWRQACKTSVLSDCTVLIPVESRGLKRPLVQQLDMGKAERSISVLHAIPLAEGWKLDPMAMKVPLRLNPPTAQDNASDLTRFSIGMRQQHHIDHISADVPCLKTLPKILRANDWFVTATLVTDPVGGAIPLSGAEKDGPWRLVRIEGGNTSDQNLAVALDIGTTTVSGQLMDLRTGEALAETAEYNGQIQYGADVITRIVFAQKPNGSKKLQSVVVSSINQVIDELLERTGHSKRSISYVAAAGNTTMTHLLLGMETRYIREAPYVPAAASMPLEMASEIGIDLPDCVKLYTFPSVASYVGGDIVSGILGSGVFQKEELTLYIDIGTNGEIVLGNRDWLACAACSMGPAFEGGGIKHGMRADLGAIEGFHINPVTLEPMVVTVGRAKPRGICGSGLISVLSELLSACVIDRNGKFAGDLSSTRIRQGHFGSEYVLAWTEDSATGEDIVITEVDIENLIRAKGALFAGCLTLLESLSLSFDALDRVIIAGAFGRYINLEKGKVIGLFPDIPVEKFHFLGNGSLLGARLVCLSRGMLREVKRIAQMMTNIELSDNQSFMDKYMGALFLPHTEDRLFPHVSHYLETSSEMIRHERSGL